LEVKLLDLTSVPGQNAQTPGSKINCNCITIDLTTMHGTEKVKIINAQYAKTINNFRNTKEKLLRANAAIWFNKPCRANHLTPKYIHLKVAGNNQQSKPQLISRQCMEQKK
jgi:hypothetical protein